jgi:hypothetical protein
MIIKRQEAASPADPSESIVMPSEDLETQLSPSQETLNDGTTEQHKIKATAVRSHIGIDWMFLLGAIGYGQVLSILNAGM